MNLDDFISELRKWEHDAVVAGLALLLSEWQADLADANDLARQVERYFRNTRIEDDQMYRDVYQKWNDFKNSAIDNIGSQTINERLYWFGLLDRFDNASEPEIRCKLYAKLLASA